jgi:NADPH-dependent 2,4-dienoyl-CoA reductase/sulfur reductase-like enzyme
MRVTQGKTRPVGVAARFTFDGEALTGLAGESLAAALTAAGRLGLRRDGAGGSRGVYCGMGVCQECLVTVDGAPHRRACVTALRDGMAVATDDPLAPALPLAETDSPPPAYPAGFPLAPDLLVVGGGPAGLSAALAARQCGAEVVLLDERPALGGQYFKQLSPAHAFAAGRPGDRQYGDGARLIEAVRAAGVRIHSGAQVWSGFAGPEIALGGPDGGTVLRPRRLVLATGAYERGLPVPGWTLPGVMTTGAAQTLLRAYRVLPGRRVLVAGNGPLNLQVAAELVEAGAEVAAVAELARRPGLGALPDLFQAAVTSPDLLRDGAGYLARLRWAGVPVLWGHILAEAVGPAGGRVEEAVLALAGGSGLRRYAVDAICMGYGFLPQIELARAIGCDHEIDPRSGALLAVRGEDGRTSLPEVFVAGDAGGLGGARAAQVQGRMAGLAAARDLGYSAGQTPRLSAELRRHRRFQAALWRIFEADPPMPPASGVTVCRCENLTLGDVEAALETGAETPGALKRMTRLGMGRCQGRYCMPLLTALLAARRGGPVAAADYPAPRAPAKPVRIVDLAARPASGHVAITEESGTVGD